MNCYLSYSNLITDSTCLNSHFLPLFEVFKYHFELKVNLKSNPLDLIDLINLKLLKVKVVNQVVD